MNGIILRSNETFEKALRRFVKTCEKCGVLSEVRKNQFFEKPSERKKRKLNQARRKATRDRLIEEGVIKIRPKRRP